MYVQRALSSDNNAQSWSTFRLLDHLNGLKREHLVINGGYPLKGEVTISGSKNATLPILAACLLTDGESIIHNAADIGDVRALSTLLSSIHVGVVMQRHGSTLTADATKVDPLNVPHDIATSIRASILLLGPLLARFGKARIPLPGACLIGARQIDENLNLRSLGANIELGSDYIDGREPHGLHGARIVCSVPSVTATEKILTAAAMARGSTEICNCAADPEIEDLALALQAMGAEIYSAGTSLIIVHGRPSLTPFTYNVMNDRIECGTLLMAGALLGSPLTIKGVMACHQQRLLGTLRAMGARIHTDGRDSMTIWRAPSLQAVNVQTGPYPSSSTGLKHHSWFSWR